MGRGSEAVWRGSSGLGCPVTARVGVMALILAGCASHAPPPAAAPAPPPSVAAPAPRPAAVPSIMLTRKQEIANALISLNSGEVGTARVGIVQMLAERPNDPVAADLLRQIDTDPKVLLGERSYSYTIRRRETLSMIAGRLLGDPNRFWALARYNGIAVPSSAGAGRVIQIPGVAPVARVRPPKPETPTGAKAVAPVPPVAAAATPRIDVAGAARLRRAGLDEMARGSINQAVSLLERALALNPEDATIQADLARARKVQQTVRQN